MANQALSPELPSPANGVVVNDIRHSIGHFVPNPYLRLGDADSAHEVIFGQLEPHGAVAVKPFTREGRARRELTMITKIRERGFDTLEPLAVATGSLGTYLITRYRPGLHHLGQLNWAVDVASPKLKSVLTPSLHSAAEVAGNLHAAGITHGDFQAKNVAFDRQGPVVLDLERAQVGRPTPDYTTDRAKDLSMFGFTVLGRGLLHDRSPNYRARFLGEEFVIPSLEKRQGRRVDESPEDTRDQIQAEWMEAIRRGKYPQWLQRQVDHPS